MFGIKHVITPRTSRMTPNPNTALDASVTRWVFAAAFEFRYIAGGNSRKNEQDAMEPINPYTTPRFVMNSAPASTSTNGMIVSAACCKSDVSVSPAAR